MAKQETETELARWHSSFVYIWGLSLKVNFLFRNNEAYSIGIDRQHFAVYEYHGILIHQ